MRAPKWLPATFYSVTCGTVDPVDRPSYRGSVQQSRIMTADLRKAFKAARRAFRCGSLWARVYCGNEVIVTFAVPRGAGSGVSYTPAPLC